MCVYVFCLCSVLLCFFLCVVVLLWLVAIVVVVWLLLHEHLFYFVFDVGCSFVGCCCCLLIVPHVCLVDCFG